MHTSLRYGQCPHLESVLDGFLTSPKSSKSTTGTQPSAALLSNWKFLQEYLHLWRLKLVDPTKVCTRKGNFFTFAVRFIFSTYTNWVPYQCLKDS